jgi:hypothetical protein
MSEGENECEWIVEKSLRVRSDEAGLYNLNSEIGDLTERHTSTLKGEHIGNLSQELCNCRPATYHL